MPSNIQSIIFDKTKYNTSQARSWIKKHNFTPLKKVHTTEEYHRYRIEEPEKYNRFITKDFGDGVKAVIGFNGVKNTLPTLEKKIKKKPNPKPYE